MTQDPERQSETTLGEETADVEERSEVAAPSTSPARAGDEPVVGRDALLDGATSHDAASGDDPISLGQPSPGMPSANGSSAEPEVGDDVVDAEIFIPPDDLEPGSDGDASAMESNTTGGPQAEDPGNEPSVAGDASLDAGEPLGGTEDELAGVGGSAADGSVDDGSTEDEGDSEAGVPDVDPAHGAGTEMQGDLSDSTENDLIDEQEHGPEEERPHFELSDDGISDGDAGEGTDEAFRDGLTIQVGKIEFTDRAESKDDRKPDEDRQLPPKLTQDRLRRVKDLFHPSPGYASLVEDDFGEYEGRVFVVYGPEYAGKLTTAVRLGLQLAGGDVDTARLHVYHNRLYHTVTIFDLLEGRCFDKPAVHIFEDAFDNEVLDLEVIVSSLESLNGLFDDKESYLILTSEKRLEELEELNVEKIPAVLDDLEGVFNAHLRRYSEGVETVAMSEEVARLAGKEWKHLQKHLKHPVQIERFCHKLSGLPSGAGREALIDVAHQAARIGQDSMRPWFSALHANEKLYAMLMVLFGGIERTLLNEIYIQAVTRLRTDGVTVLCDPREIGLDDLLEKIHASESERVVEFQDRALTDEVRRQVKNHHHLLWSITGVLIDLAQRSKAPQDWQFRANIGAVIGHLGLYHRVKFMVVIESLAEHSSGAITSIAGSAMDQVCRSDAEGREEIEEVLESWATSGSPDRMWAVGAAVWRIYQGLVSAAGVRPKVDGKMHPTLRRLFDVLATVAKNASVFERSIRQRAYEQLRQQFQGQVLQVRFRHRLESWTIDNVNSVIYALRKMVWVDPRSTVDELCTWLDKEGESNLRFLSYLTCQKIFEDALADRTGQIRENHGALLDLAAPLLAAPRSRDQERSVAAMMVTLRRWLRWPKWSERIFQCLLRLANEGDPRVAGRLCSELAQHWLESRSEAACRMGQALIARSRAMSGIPLWPPGMGHGVIALDASPPALAQGTGAKMGRWLHHLIDPIIDTTILRMGHRDPLLRPGEIPGGDLQSPQTHPRLLVPALEALDEEPAWLVAVAWGAIDDLEDLDPAHWQDRLVVAWGGRPKSAMKDYPRVLFKARSSSVWIESLEQGLADFRLRTLTRADPKTWIPTLEKTLGCHWDVATVVQQLEERIDGLDNPDSATGRDDSARLIVCTLLALAETDLEATAELLSTWLDADELDADGLDADGSCRALMGRSAAQALFRFNSYRQPLPDPASCRPLLELGPQLVARDWTGAETVFRSALLWAVDSRWSDFLTLVSSPWIKGWLEALHPEHGKMLERGLVRWGKEIPDGVLRADDEKRRVLSLSERIGSRLALSGRGQDLALPEDLTLGLVVIDGALNESARQRCAELASVLVKGLAKMTSGELSVVVHQLGRASPIALPGDEPAAADLMATEKVSRPRLLSPVLVAHAMAQVRFVLVLAGGHIVDGEDWFDTPWSRKVSLYSIGNGFHHRGFARIPAAKRLAEVDSILRHLELKIGT